MNCLLCGHLLGPTALLTGDRDFCAPLHRREYHERLRRVLVQLSDLAEGVVPPAPFAGGSAKHLCVVEGVRGTILANWFGPTPRLPGLALGVAAEAAPAAEPEPAPKVTIRSRKVREILQMTSSATG
jgi:hypothetical protein